MMESSGFRINIAPAIRGRDATAASVNAACAPDALAANALAPLETSLAETADMMVIINAIPAAPDTC